MQPLTCALHECRHRYVVTTLTEGTLRLRYTPLNRPQCGCIDGMEPPTTELPSATDNTETHE